MSRATMTDVEHDERKVESLTEWWETDATASLSRSDWSAILDELNEGIDSHRLGDHIDRKVADELQAIAERLTDQVDTMPPGNLIRKHDPDQDLEDV